MKIIVFSYRSQIQRLLYTQIYNHDALHPKPRASRPVRGPVIVPLRPPLR
jgi:hypothetical protein